MGNLTAKTSGDIASFMTPAETNITSLKVHFSPKQLGEGDPSPENVREIEGWDGVEVAKSSVNLLDQSYILKASGWILSSDDGNTMYCGVPVYKGNINKFYTKFKSGYPFIGNPFKENVQYNVSVWLKTVNGNSIQGLKFGFKYTDGTTSLGGIFAANDTWKRQTVTSKANKTVSGIHCSYNSGGEIYLCGLAVCEKEFDDINIVHSSTANDISYQWKKLPNEYQEVEYIESDGEQYIDTRILPSSTDVYSFKGEFLNKDNSVLFGCRSSGTYRDSNQLYLNRNVDKNIKSVMFIVNTANNSNTEYTKNVFFYNGDNLPLEIDGKNISINGRTSESFNPTQSIYLLGFNVLGTNNKTVGGGKLVYFKIDGRCNFIPCYRKSDGEIGMYDTVSQTFYTNQGTGTFLKGNDVDKTFYGGYIDLIKGELVETHTYQTFDGDEPWSAYGSDVYRFALQPSNGFPKKKNGQDNIICDSYSAHGYNSNYYVALSGTQVLYPTAQDLKDALSQNPIHACYELLEPITHQLTPTQLSSFVGQNNFWSNADYVEIEYELKETEDIQKARKKIILNQPHIETVKDDLVNFTTDMKAPLKECKVYFEPIQEGEGDPSPDNVRNITGWDGVEVKNGDNVYSINWIDDAGTVYGGYVDLVSGELVAEWELAQGRWGDIRKKQVNISTGYDIGILRYNNPIKKCYAQTDYNKNTICNIINVILWNTHEKTPEHYYGGNTSTTNKGIMYISGNFDDDLIIQIAARLTEPIHYQLTPQQLLTLKGTNNIWSNSNGQTEVKFWTY